MRTFIFLCCISAFSFTPDDIFSQNIKVKIDVNKTLTVDEVFDLIMDQTDYKFIYQEGIFKDFPKVKVKKGTISANKLLQKSLSGSNFNVVLSPNKTVLVNERPVVSKTQPRVQIRLSGKVLDSNNQPLPGANIVEKGTSNGTQTDFDGNFSLDVESNNAVLIVSYLGFVTQEVNVDGKTELTINMVEDAAALDEVVVVGYGTQAKKDVTGSIASIASEAIETRPVSSVDNVLQGLATGLNVASRGGSPGQLSKITVRSIGSLSAGFEPLWVIDGFPTDQRNAQAINPASIESVQVLKDASSTAIYGSRGANGVIIITTKSGRKGKAQFNVSVTSGFASIPKSSRLEVLNAAEYVQYHTEANGGVTPDYINNYWDGQTDTDWQEELFETSPFQNYSISASGGTEKVSYLLSGSFIDEQGVIPGEGFEKYSAQLKLEYRASDKLTFGLNLAPNYSIINSHDVDAGSTAYAQAITLAPIIPVRRSDGSFSLGQDFPGFATIGNPLESVLLNNGTQDIFRFLGGLNISYEIIDNLILKSTLSANFGSDNFQTIYNSPGDGFLRNGYGALSTLNLRKTNQVGWLNENTITYKRTFGDHSFDVLGGFTLQKDKFSQLQSNVAGLQVQGPTILSLGDTSTLTSTNAITENTLVSYLGRVNYSYKDRYLVTGTVRNDASSRFGANNRSQTFGSFALGWRLSEEDFMQKLEFVNNAKLRVSFGTTGSNAIPNFISRSSLGPVNHSFGATGVTGVAITSPGNADLTWETSKQSNIGLDLTLFNNRVDMVLDYYNNETTSLLLSRNLVPSSGYTGFLTNIGSMENKGVEISINAKIVENEDFEWSVGGQVAKNDQEIIELGGDNEIRNFFGALRRTVGGELQNIHVTEAVGVLREGQTLPAGLLTATANPQAGDIIYRDVNGDGSISNFLGPDGQNLEGVNIDWVYGFNTRLRYKDFELSALFTGQAGAHVLDLYQIQVASPTVGPGTAPNVNISKEYWYDGRYISESQPGDGRTPRAGGFNDGISTVSSLGNHSTDYLRFKNITLTYNLPQSWLEKVGIFRASVYSSIENVYLWSKFVGGNSDIRSPSGGGQTLSGGSRIPGVSDGLETGVTYHSGMPLPRTFTLGVNFNF